MSKPKTLKVRAAVEGRPCPKMRKRARPNRKTGRDPTMIYHDEIVEVPNHSFYRRAIRRGDLELVVETELAQPKPARRVAAPRKSDTPEG
jgi:hypothetical protein